MAKHNRITPIFPKWVDSLRPVLGASLLFGLPVFVIVLVWLGGSPKTLQVGYMPDQPVPYSHALHAGELGIDCRYCHNTVENAAHAAIPPTQTCMNCHAKIRTESPKLAPVRASYASGTAVEWVRIHDLPDYVYFNHSAHVTRGIGCVECHDRVDTMEVVYQANPLSMGWCLDCHRNPNSRIRPKEFVTDMDWEPSAGETREALGTRLRQEYGINPSEDCSTCHR